MSTNLRPQLQPSHTHLTARGAVRGAVRVRAIKAIAHVAALPASDGRIAGETIRQLRKAVRGCVTNKMAATLYDLLSTSGRADEFAALIREMFAPGSVHAPSLNDALVLEVDVKCEEMPVLARALSGHTSGPELRELRDKLVADRMALDLAIESVDTELTAKRMIA